MSVNTETALKLVKQRLNRLESDTTIDEYLENRINSAAEELEGTGIILEDTPGDLMLLVDTAVWQYQNRDQSGEVPPWLRLRRRERWLQQVHRGEEEDA